MRPETAEETLMTVLPDPRTHAGTTVVDPPVPAVDDVRWDAGLRRVLARPAAAVPGAGSSGMNVRARPSAMASRIPSWAPRTCTPTQ